MISNNMNPAELFTRCGHFLCGPGSKWKEQFGDLLAIQTNTVDNMSKGTSRVPAGMWTDIARLVQERVQTSAPLIQAIFAITDPGMAGQPDFHSALSMRNSPAGDFPSAAPTSAFQLSRLHPNPRRQG